MIKSFIRFIKRFSSNDVAISQDKQLFGGLTREQKYAYIFTIETFRTFADNVPPQNDDEYSEIESERLGLYLDNILNRCLSLLSMTPDNLDDAISYMNNTMPNPQVYLKEIDFRIKDSLLFFCYKIAETKKGIYNGENINKLAKDYLYDFFEDLGYTPDKIEETIIEIKNWPVGNSNWPNNTSLL